MLGKLCKYFDGSGHKIVKGLVDAGFELHTVSVGCPTLENISLTVHGPMPPKDFSDFLQQFVFVVGLGDPILSPTPIEGLYAGVAFLNPVGSDGYPLHYESSQHVAIADLGAPYVFNYPHGTLWEVWVVLTALPGTFC